MSKIAFLFLVVSGINHEATWQEFLMSHEKKYSLYVHSKKPLASDSPFKKNELETRIPTTWHNTMKAQVELLKRALVDKQNQKFIFLSESTIPLKPFEYVYQILNTHSLSEFSFEPSPYRRRTFEPLKKETVYTNSQWVILNRKHAELMVADQELIEIFNKNPFDNEHYPSTFLYHHGLLQEVKPTDRTFVFWPDHTKKHPHTFESLDTDIYLKNIIDALKDPELLFGRKFSKECDLSILKKLGLKLR